MAAPWIGGVASGIGSYLGIPVAPVRIAFAALSPLGIGVLVYLGFWLALPTDSAAARQVEVPSGSPSDATLRAPLRQVGGRRDKQVVVGRLFVAGVAFLVAALALVLLPFVSYWDWTAVAAGAAILIGLGVTWLQAPRFADGSRLSASVLVALGLFLIGIGTAVMAQQMGVLYQLRSGLLIALAILLGVTLALLPLAFRMYRDLTTSRLSEVRETERAEIAAHLHDSVLQTLTLIRGAADDPARVRSLALTQEGELRSWLYTGSAAPGESVAQSLRDQAATAESTYGVAVEVVTVGDLVPGPTELAAVAAASEAITNAVRHGAPPVTVFQEVRPNGMEISVKDAGPGFDPTDIPRDRHGFRNSITGRIERVGGVVEVRSTLAANLDSGEEDNGRSGTEIRIRVPRSGTPRSRSGEARPREGVGA